MQCQEYQRLAARTAKPLSLPKAFEHMGMGVASDMGEMTSIIKKIHVYGADIDAPVKKGSEKTNRVHLREECGDVSWFIAYGCDLIKVELGDIITLEIHDQGYRVAHMFQHSPVWWALQGCRAAGKLAGLVNESGIIPEQSYNCRQYLAMSYICVAQIAQYAGYCMAEVFEYNIRKLRERYPDIYTDQAALERKDDRG